MSEKPVPPVETLFRVLSTLARLSATTTDLYSLLNSTLHTCLDMLPISGAAIWLRDHEQDIFAPAVSRMPQNCSTSAISEDEALIQQVLERECLLLEASEARSLIDLPDHLLIALAPVQNEDAYLGLFGFVAEKHPLTSLCDLLEASANVLSSPIASAWLRRQQAESDDIESILFTFSGELREQTGPETILRTLNQRVMRLFACDWSAVYQWQGSNFAPIHIITHVGEQPVDEEPALSPQDSPLLEAVLSNLEPLSIRDLHHQPNALPVYTSRHNLRGVVLVPLQKTTNNPLGLLAIGYWAPLSTFSGRANALADGLAHMVAVALERTQTASSASASQM